MKRIFFFILAILCGVSISSAQEKVRLSLNELIEMGLDRNFDLRIVRNTQEKTVNNATLGNAGYLPSLDLSAGYSGTLNDISQKDREGNYTDNNGIFNQNYNAGLNLNYTLFDGFTVQTTYKRLKELENLGELNVRMTVEDFIYTFSTQYYNYIRQYIRLKNLRNAVALSQERLRIVETHRGAGSMSGLDLQQARVDLNSDKSQLVKQYETMHDQKTNLNQLLALDNIELQIYPADSVIDIDPTLNYDFLKRSMADENVFLMIASKEGDLSKLDLKLIKSDNYPYLRLNTGYGYTGNKYGSSTIRKQDNLGLNYGVTLGFTIFDGLNQKRKIRNAELDIRNTELNYQQTELSLKKGLADAWHSYTNNKELLELEKSNVETARLNYEIARYMYETVNQLSGIELREAQNNLFEAEERVVQALYDAKISEITLYMLAGRITEYLKR